MGSLLAAGLATFAADGSLTGAAPTNQAERDRFYREGKQPYAIKIGDQWVSYQRLEPLNQTFSQVASVVDAINAGDDKGAMELAFQVGADIGANLLSQTFVTGLNDAMQAFIQPERYGTQWAERMAGSLAVPFSSAMRTAAQAVDPYIRQPQGIAETIAANVPGLSQNVPARLTAFGEPIQRETAPLNPYATSTEKTDPMTVELNRLQYNTGFVGSSISNVPLNREQQRQYQEIAGQLTKRLFERVIARDAYQQMNDSQRIELLDKLTAEARKTARDYVLDQMVQQRLQERQAAGGR
jgi:Fe-S cluster biosynthesis and repair protein YggX